MPVDEPYRTGRTWPAAGPAPVNQSYEDLVALLDRARVQGENLVGLSLDEAVAVATSRGVDVRLAREDETGFVMTMELNFRRINLEVVEG
jgi:hypothetical protein